MRILSLLFVGIFLSSTSLFAQQTCGTDHFHQQRLENDPHYRLEMQDFEAYIQSPQFLMRQPHTIGGVTVYRIPVVVHVMHKGEAVGVGTNVSKTAILNSIQSLNSRYRKILNGIGYGNGVDIEVEFSLAVRDPNGNCTDGIVRYDMTGQANYMSFGVNSSNTNGMDDDVLKAFSFWDSNKYYNIWIVSEIDDNNGGAGVQGYAYFASSHGQTYDGAVMIPSCITDTARVTLAHEIGHALNLYHTFQGDANGTACPANANCTTDGDLICDTPPHIRSASNCPAGTNACDGGSNNTLYYHNYMDYSADNCQNEFTAGQKTRMIAALTGPRASLLAENGNLSLVPPSTAGIDFYATKAIVCPGSKVQFFDLSSCTPNNFIKSIGWPGISFSWTLTNNSGTTLTSTDQNPIFTLSVAGTYDATLVITNPNGTTSATKQGIIIVTAAPIAPTCTGSNSSPGSNFFYGIYGVYLNTLAHNSDGTFQDIQSGVTNGTGYGDFSCTASTILSANTTYTFTLKGSSNTGIFEDFKVYIDYNNDGDFVDTGEEILWFNDITGTSSYLTQNFTTPASPTFNTPLRMRVFSSRNNESITPCLATARGQIQDYSVIISNRIASVTIAAAPSTTITYGTNVTFTATPVNGGTTPTYQWYVNGVLQSGFTGATFNSTTLLNGNQVYCVMTSNLSGVIASPATSNTLTMVVTGPPLSDFTQNKTVTCAGGTVIYTDQSLLVPTSWSWTFAGGTPGTSTVQNPSVVYNTAGTYNTTLTASNGLGTGTTRTYTSLINVYTAPTAICNAFVRTTAPAAGIGITRVTVNTINNSTVYNDAVYIDNSCSMITKLTAGSTYSIEVQLGTSNPQWLRVYIDYNADNDFLDAGETIFSPATNSGLQSGTFTVPMSANSTQLLRMRVITDFVNTTAGSCTNSLQYGQAEDYGVVISGSGLPIRLTSFKAQRLNDLQALVHWELGSFSDVKGFYVERSTDGIYYSVLDSILPGTSYSAVSSRYSITDPSAPEGVTYYRLKTRYLDGSLEFSPSATLSDLNSKETQVYIYPVPVTEDEVKVYYGNISGTIQWELIDLDGRTSSKGIFNIGEGTDYLNLSKVSNGVYTLRLITGSQTYVQKITILR